MQMNIPETWGSELEKLFVDSIRAKQPIIFLYGDKERHACPYLLGKTGAGRVVAHCLSQSAVNHDSWEWRFFYLDSVLTAPRYSKGLWYTYLQKQELAGPYKPPAFIKEVLAQVAI
jgi:hypothetical protein